MSEPYVRADSLPAPAVALLRAVHGALELPLPGLTDADERAYHVLMHDRASQARIILECVLIDGHELGPAAERLNTWTAELPVNYTPWTDGRGAV
ncbi:MULTISPECIES: hypothetical protein [Streptomyces]|uniref:Uncharacterized protein n=1 Tax=Streptomyces eurythermus TaxID=42237 RepID=A0ABW6YT73_9ACTN|nr:MULTISPECIES: hypothetical protein [Streptomyces]QIS71935.1 hypothetical protein HB370_19675 [Streptomyces sp. DSM 40868]WDM14734.1 hypothetical protein J3S85_26420 [Streptomyces lavenduligriseus]